MKIKFKTRVVLGTLLFLLFVVSCRQEFLKEDSPSHSATHKSKFQVVKLKDIPHVSNFIKMKTGRKDLKIPMAGKSLAYSKGALEFESLETDFILKKEEGEVAYYIFGISNAGDESTIYNFEVKEVGGDIERAELIEFSSATPYEEDYSNLFRFSGTVTAYNEQKQQVSIGIFDEGVNPECPSTYPPGEGGGGGGGETPVITPGWPPDPYNPIPADWPQWPGSPPDSGGGGESGGNIPPNTAGCGEYMLAIFFYENSNGDDVGLWVNECGHQYFGSQPKSYAIMTTNKIGPHCNDGSGIIILPGNPMDTPCKKIKEQREDEDFKEKIQDLQSKTGLKKETGYTHRSDGSSTYHDNASATDEKNTLHLPKATLSNNKNITCFTHTHVDDFWYTNSEGIYRPKEGIKIFSPADINYFMQLVINAQEEGRPLDSVCGIMISSMVNYQIRFTGNQYQIKTFTKAQLDIFRVEFEKYMRYRKDKSKSLEFGFLKFLDEKMNLKGVVLYRMNDDNSTTEIKLNSNKSETTESKCP